MTNSPDLRKWMAILRSFPRRRKKKMYTGNYSGQYDVHGDAVRPIPSEDVITAKAIDTTTVRTHCRLDTI